MGESGTAKLRVRARLINLIGEDLISDEPVALVELVKNSYDADASRSVITFRTDDKGEFVDIIIEDDGHGMDLDAVLGAWLEPGTISKTNSQRSRARKRQLQGAKGIGRFASARLGNNLLMETKEKGSGELISVLFNWGMFTDDSYLDEVSVEYSLSETNTKDHFTRLTIGDIRPELWDEDALRTLHNRLSRLLSPFEDFSDFEIYLEVEGNDQYSGLVEPPDLLKGPIYNYSGSVSNDGLLNATLDMGGQQTTLADVQLLAKGERPECGPFSFEIRAWDRDEESLMPIAKKHDLSIGRIRQILNQFCGVSIYRDGFRVYPYGERGNDWANLDSRSRQNPTRNLANNQIIAAIEISREENPELRDRSNREGMVRNPAHDDLEFWFKAALSKLEEARYAIRPKKATSKATANQIFEELDISSLLDIATKNLGKNHPVAQALAEKSEKIDRSIEELQNSFSTLVMSASVGHLVDLVLHELGSPLGKAGRALGLLRKRLHKELDNHPVLAKADEKMDVISSAHESLYNLREGLDPQTAGKRGRATRFAVQDEVRLIVDIHKSVLSSQKIVVKIDCPNEPIIVFMSRSALSQIVANLLDNAMYWVRHKHGKKGGGKILISMSAIPDGFVLRFSDNGPGVAASSADLIFEPHYSTKPSGMGLGLHLSRLIIERYGRLILAKPDKGDSEGAVFEAKFERGVGRK